jgi:excisionase family DNA binding protein
MDTELKSAPAERPRVLTVEEAGAILRLSRSAAWTAVWNGQIPTLRIGKRVLVPTEALDKLLAGAGAR